jgi:NAD(P)-dependent dehydrogenase (short-subunit alcohol dehydrogenase family)
VEKIPTVEGTLVRYGRPHEVVAMVAFLASEEGRFIGGQVIRVEGGSVLAGASGRRTSGVSAREAQSGMETSYGHA